MSKEKRRVPKLRFPGFTEDWEQRKLSEVTTCFDNLRVAVTASDRVPGKIPYYGANGIQDYVSGHTHSGEFVLIAEDGANDLNDYPIQYVNGAIWVNNHAHVIAGYKEKLENNFLSYSLKTVKMTTFIVGGGRSKLNLKALLEIPISMPNYDEQCVIGEFIETIDKNITLHQRKLNNLKLKKKALFQKLFPKNGERYPELRFPGFTDAWEQCKLKSIANTIVAGGDIDKNKIKESGTYPVIANALTKDGVVGYYEDTYRIEAPAVTVTGRGDIGVAKARHQNFTPVVRLLSLTTAHDVDFIENAINNLKIVSESTGVAQLTVPQLSNYKIHITSILEERKIGLFISKVDNLITLHQRKLDHLQLQKKALLQQMFV